MNKKESEEIKGGGCAEAGCPNKATKKIKTQDGLEISLCEEHYKKWGGEKVKERDRRLAKIRRFFRLKK